MENSSYGLNTNFISPNSHQAQTEINTFQSQSLIGKLVSNKYIYIVREMAVRYIETFDPHYLFLEGDLNPNRSNQKNGPIFFTLFVLAIVYPKRNLWKWGALALLPTIVFGEHYFTPSKILFFIFLSYLGSLELNLLYKSNKKWFIISLVFLLIEFLYFLYNFV